MSLKSLFIDDLSQEELNLLPNSFDFIGNKILENFSNVKVVAKKVGLVKGKFRTRKIKVIAGENRKETLYKENGVLLKLNVETSYFSPRLATERLRIAKSVKGGEVILVMFAGVLPYPLVISKNSNANFIYTVEANSEAYKYGLENINLNKADNIKSIKGDVKRVFNDEHIKKILENKRFDRIIMPLPKDAANFLKITKDFVKKGTIINFYDFQEEDNFSKSLTKIKKIYKKIKVLDIVKCGQISPGKYRICVDFKIINF